MKDHLTPVAPALDCANDIANVRVSSPKLKQHPPEQLPGSQISNAVVDAFSPGKLLDELVSTIQSYVVMDKEQADAAALWIAMTWFIKVIEVAPLALITAPEKACGKSQLLTIFGYLVAAPLPVANLSASFVFRSIEISCPTILIDEADTFLRENSELKGIINAGHTRANAYVGRTESNGNGVFTPKLFSVWCAKAMAGIGIEKHLPAATISRAIMITLRRKMAHEKVSRLRHADRSAFEPLATKLAKFAESYAERIRTARPDLPDALSDRAQDNWEPLLAIAECAGPEWFARATAAALKLSKSEDDAVSTGNELLADIQYIFEKKKQYKISTVDLISELVDDEEKPWATYCRGKPITPRQLARLLDGYGIKSKTVRMQFGTPKGFDAGQFEDAFARYLGTPANSAQQGHDLTPDAQTMTSIRNPLSDASDTQFLQEPVSSPKPSTPSAATTKLWEAVERAHVAEDAPRVPFDKRPDSDF